MTFTVGLNGFGRIGRCVLRSVFENSQANIRITAINDLCNNETLAHLLRYDSVHGRFPFDIEIQGDYFIIKGQKIRVTAERDPQNLPWNNVDIAFECTGFFTDGAKAAAHLKNGVKRILISAPGKNADKTIVYGVNHYELNKDHIIVSNASCTTNCLAPLVKVLDDAFGIKTGYMTTIHAYTGDQSTHDRDHKDLYRARAAAVSMIPTSTGAARAISLVLPHLAGRLEGSAVRVPTLNVSLVDLTFVPNCKPNVDEIHNAMKAASDGFLKGILAFDTAPKVSIDYNHSAMSSNYAAPQTCVTKDGLVRVVAWYDNEWGFSNRMIDTSCIMAGFI